MTDDPAPPGGVEQVGPGAGVLEIEERPDLAVVAHHDVDRGEIAMNEHALVRGVRRGWIRSSLVGGIAVELDGPESPCEPTHPVGEVASPVGIAKPARPGHALDPGGEQPWPTGHLSDDGRWDRQAGPGKLAHEPADALSASVGLCAGEPAKGEAAAVGKPEPMGGVGIPPRDGLGRADG